MKHDFKVVWARNLDVPQKNLKLTQSKINQYKEAN